MAAWLANQLMRHRGVLFAVWLGSTLLAAIWAGTIEFDFTPRVMFAGHGDMLEFSEDFKRRFGYEDALVLLVIEALGPHDALSAECLNWQHAVGRRIARLAPVERVLSVADLKLPRLRILGSTRVAAVPLVAHWPADRESAERARRVLAHSNLADRSLVSVDRRTAVVACLLEPAARDIHLLRQWIPIIERVAREEPLPPGCRLHLQGLPALRAQIVDELMLDQRRLLPLVALTFLVLLWSVYRVPSLAILPLVASGTGLAWTMALLVLLGQSLNIISNVLPVLLFVIGVSNCAHVLGRFREEYAQTPDDPRTATQRTVAHMLVPCLLTYLTTAIGFGSLIWADSAGLRSFGWQAALGMLLLYISTIVVLGLLLPSCRIPRRQTSISAARFTRLIGRATYTPRAYVAVCAALVVLLCGLSWWWGRQVPINSRLVETYSEDHPTVQTMYLVDRQLGGFVPLEISLAADRPGRFVEPEVLRRVARIEEFARGCPEVLFARGYLDLLDEIHAQTRASAPRLADPETAEPQARARIARAHRLATSMAPLIGFEQFLSADGQQARLLLRTSDLGTARTLQLAHRLEQQLAESFPPGSGITFRLTGDGYLNARAMDGFVRDMLSSLIGAAVIIFGVIGLLFRSLRLGLIAVIPNLTPLVLTWGYLGLRGYELNVANVIVFAIGLGVAVDDTVHFLSRYLEERAHGVAGAEAIRRVLQSAGQTMMFTTVLIVGGLTVLHFSQFLPTRRFAELMAVTMLSALAGDLLVLPACLLASDRSRSNEAQVAGDSARSSAAPGSP